MADLTRVASVGLHYLCLYENCNPDVGMGPSAELLLEKIMVEMELQPYEVDEQALVQSARGWLR